MRTRNLVPDAFGKNYFPREVHDAADLLDVYRNHRHFADKYVVRRKAPQLSLATKNFTIILVLT